MQITVSGQKLEVVENLGFQAEHHVKVVRKPDGTEAVAVRLPGAPTWRFWEARDKVTPELQPFLT